MNAISSKSAGKTESDVKNNDARNLAEAALAAANETQRASSETVF